jgi:hypothetical protein
MSMRRANRDPACQYDLIQKLSKRSQLFVECAVRARPSHVFPHGTSRTKTAATSSLQRRHYRRCVIAVAFALHGRVSCPLFSQQFPNAARPAGPIVESIRAAAGAPRILISTGAGSAGSSPCTRYSSASVRCRPRSRNTSRTRIFRLPRNPEALSCQRSASARRDQPTRAVES